MQKSENICALYGQVHIILSEILTKRNILTVYMETNPFKF